MDARVTRAFYARLRRAMPAHDAVRTIHISRCLMSSAQLLTSLALLAAFAGTALAQSSEAEFFRGKTISLGVPSSVGGGYDTYARLIARHIPKHIPGNPAVVTRNLPAAGGLVLANTLYNSSPR